MYPEMSSESADARRSREEMEGEPVTLEYVLRETASILCREFFAAARWVIFDLRLGYRTWAYGEILLQPQVLIAVTLFMEARIPQWARKQWLKNLVLNPHFGDLEDTATLAEINVLLAQVPVPKSRPD